MALDDLAEGGFAGPAKIVPGQVTSAKLDTITLPRCVAMASKTAQNITGSLSTVADAPAKAVLTSIIAALVALGLATDGTT